MAKKATGMRLKGKYGTAYQGPKVQTCEGSGQSSGVDIPRYDKLGFKMRLTPDSPGLIKAHRGAKLFDGIFKYPRTADVDPVQAARAQALADYNYTVNSRGGPCQRANMARIYGEAYTKEFERLKTAKYGPPARWA